MSPGVAPSGRHSGRSPGGKTGSNSPAHVKGPPYTALVTGHFKFAGVDQGIDFTSNGGSFTIHALDDCTITSYRPTSGWPGPRGPSTGSVIVYKLTAGPGQGKYVYNAEAVVPVSGLREGVKYSKGDAIATVNSSYPGCEIGWATSSGLPLAPRPPPRPANQYTAIGADFQKFVLNGDSAGAGGGGGGGGGSGSGGGGGGGSTDTEGIARAAALSALIELPGIFNTLESNSLAGQKSLMNDQPLLPFIEQLSHASLREFQSMPNGNFFAFFPDYFGGLSHRTAYWEIDDVEIIDGSIKLSDDPLATHVYVVGDTQPSFGTIDLQDKMLSSGVMTLFNAFSANFITGVNSIQKKKLQSQDVGSGPGVSFENPADIAIDAIVDSVATFGEKERALKFLQKYGARPHYEEAPMVRSPYYELFLAYQKFMMLWSQQFLTTFTFTFMPELYPGGIVAFPNHGIQCYVAEVSHNCDYQSGFTTSANLMAPSAFATADRTNIHEGMIRSFSLDETPFDPFAEAQAKRDKNKKKK